MTTNGEGGTVNANYYCALLQGTVRSTIRKKRLVLVSERVIVAVFITLANLHWEVLPHSSHCQDLAPSDYNCLDPLRNIGREEIPNR